MARILFVTSRLPYPPQEGHQLRSWNLLTAAASSHEVTLLSLVRPGEAYLSLEEPQSILQRLRKIPLPKLNIINSFAMAYGMILGQPLLEKRYVTKSLIRAFDEMVSDFDLVHLDILAVAALSKRIPTDIPIVFNAHNVESRLLNDRVRTEPKIWRRAIMATQIKPVERLEKNICLVSDRVLSCSAVDAGLLRGLAPSAKVTIVPNGVDLAHFAPGENPAGDDQTLVFVGQMSWFPNWDGIAHFLMTSWPKIQMNHGARLRLIGHQDGRPLPKAKAVEKTGFVTDLRPLVQDAAVYIVPLRIGSGTRLKLLEAMAMGKAIVSTQVGAEGLGLVDNVHALLADTPKEFAHAVGRLLEDRELRMRLGHAARDHARVNFGWSEVGSRLTGVYTELLDNTARLKSKRAEPIT